MMPPAGGVVEVKKKKKNEEETRRRKRCMPLFFGCVDYFASLFPFLVCLLSLAIATLSSSSSSSSVVSIPSTCRILSSSVDLRSSKVCELGLLNYKAKHVLYPSNSRTFHCRDDYYWASVFQVEYKEYLSGQIAHAVAEAPKEALPVDCRPDFGDAWLTRLKFKVNESYNCSYTFGGSKAEIYADQLFNCTAKEPSKAEIIRRILNLFLSSYSLENLNAGRMIGSAMTGVVDGMLTAVLVIGFLKSLLRLLPGTISWVIWIISKCRIRVLAHRFRRPCFLVAYVSIVCWIAMQYGKMIGFREVFFETELGEKVI